MESTYVGKRKKLKLFSDNLVISGDQSISNCEGIRKGLHLFEIDPTVPLFLSSEKPLLENIVMRKALVFNWFFLAKLLPQCNNISSRGTPNFPCIILIYMNKKS